MILDFYVENFGSFKEEGGFSFVLPSMTTQAPAEGKSWGDVTSRVVGIFGPNASGKTTLLRALETLVSAIASPGERLVPGERLYNPYKLNLGVEGDSTKYTINFTRGSERYVYIVSASAQGTEETLYAYKRSHKRLLFSREHFMKNKMNFKAGSSLRGATHEVRNLVQWNQLFLGVAYKYGHKDLKPIAQAIYQGLNIDIYMHNEMTRDINIRWMTKQIDSGPEVWKKIAEAIVGSADLGIKHIEIDKREIKPEVLKFINKVMNDGEDGGEVNNAITDEVIEQLRRSLTFYHSGENGEEFKLSLDSQSDGTKQWFSLAGRAIDALQRGSVLVVDELDSSLHPLLVKELIALFKNGRVNKNSAQIIFTSHDTSLLGKNPDRILEPYEVWFVDKNPLDGVSESYSMDEFDNRKSNNDQKRYLVGKFGAVPEPNMLLIEKYLIEA
ncbi:ATP-binding protein [Rothia mucilaginosa]|uniref:AAA family ATPase n=1 Tax=Rothia mucilaginosa TaxID=43675 RepID=UPI0028D5E114|nr:ATP-binding protein [Rothia mucilaginosa]